eukprot:5428851-Pleurochrysis_carterae.AAC.1
MKLSRPPAANVMVTAQLCTPQIALNISLSQAYVSAINGRVTGGDRDMVHANFCCPHASRVQQTK